MVRPIMVEKSVNTAPFESQDVTPSSTTIQRTPVFREATPPPQMPLLSMETCIRLWVAESKVFPQFNLHHLYELQRDIFLIMAGKQIEDTLTHNQFQTMWEFSVELKVENLFTEILARKHLRLSDPFAAFLKIGDVGARIYLYYSGCEEQLQLKRSNGRYVAERVVDWVDYGSQMAEQFVGQDSETRAQWRRNLEALLIRVKDEEYFVRILDSNLKRTYQLTLVVDFTNSHYIYNRERAEDRMERYVQAIDTKNTPVLAIQGQVLFLIPAAGYRARLMVRLCTTLEGSKANQRYLGKYPELFDDVIEQPVPTWPALAWILEDYGLSRSEPVAVDIIYKQISGPWSFEPPPAVSSHPQYCYCDRRRKWAPILIANGPNREAVRRHERGPCNTQFCVGDIIM